MYNKNDIIMAVDYHDENLVIRWFNCHTSEERLLKRSTTSKEICRLVDDSIAEAAPVDGRVIWLMESTTGWARVKDLLGNKAELVVANVLQMPLPPKAYRRKTDKIDAKRLVRILAYNEQMEPELQKRPYIYVPAKDVRDLGALFTTYSLTKGWHINNIAL